MMIANRFEVKFSIQVKVLLTLLFFVGVFALIRISYQKKQILLFYQNEQAKVNLSYELFSLKPLNASAVYVYDFTEYREIYSKNAEVKKGIASLSKLMTSLVSSDFIKEKKITVLPGMVIHNDLVNFSLGQIWKKEELEKILLVASSNNAAEILSQSFENFNQKSLVQQMNELSKKYFLDDTYFNTPTGLDEQDVILTNISTAKDVTQLVYLVYKKIPDTALATTKKVYTTRSPEGVILNIQNTNQDVERIPNLFLSKTGYTVQSGGSLTILYKSAYNKHIIGITVLDSTKTGRFTDVAELVKATDLYLELLDTRKIDNSI